MPTANLELANTFNEWRTIINEVILKVNNLENGNGDIVVDTITSNTTNNIVTIANSAWTTANVAYSTANSAWTTANNVTVSNTTFKTSYDVVTRNSTPASTINYNLTAGKFFYQTNLSANITANFVGVSANNNVATEVRLAIQQGATPYVANTITCDGSTPTTFMWAGNTAPGGTANGIDVLKFIILKDNAGGVVVLGKNDSHG